MTSILGLFVGDPSWVKRNRSNLTLRQRLTCPVNTGSRVGANMSIKAHSALGLFLYTSKTHLKSKTCRDEHFTLRHSRGD